MSKGRECSSTSLVIQLICSSFPDIPYFADPYVRKILKTVLFIWAVENPDIGYRQGMHELLAVILLVCERDSLERDLSLVSGLSSIHLTVPMSPLQDSFDDGRHSPSGAKMEDAMFMVLDRRYLEHDAQDVFAVLMQHARHWYEWRRETVEASLAQSKGQKTKVNLSVRCQGSFANSPKKAGQRSNHRDERTSARGLAEASRSRSGEAARRCGDRRPDMGNVSSRGFCITAHAHLHSSLNVRSRWIRLMFTRELPFASAIRLWDGLFAMRNQMDNLIESICVALLLRIRQLGESCRTPFLLVLTRHSYSRGLWVHSHPFAKVSRWLYRSSPRRFSHTWTSHTNPTLAHSRHRCCDRARKPSCAWNSAIKPRQSSRYSKFFGLEHLPRQEGAVSFAQGQGQWDILSRQKLWLRELY